MMMHIGCVPLRFGQSYTVSILKNSESSESVLASQSLLTTFD